MTFIFTQMYLKGKLITGERFLLGLVKRVYLHFEFGVFSQYLFRIFIRVERVHQNKGNIRVVFLVQKLQAKVRCLMH